MLFNSRVFLFLFLPLVVAAFFVIGRVSQSSTVVWLAAASLFFYAWWSLKYVLLLLASILFSFVAAEAISHSPVALGGARRRWLLTLAIALWGSYDPGRTSCSRGALYDQMYPCPAGIAKLFAGLQPSLVGLKRSMLPFRQ